MCLLQSETSKGENAPTVLKVYHSISVFSIICNNAHSVFHSFIHMYISYTKFCVNRWCQTDSATGKPYAANHWPLDRSHTKCHNRQGSEGPQCVFGYSPNCNRKTSTIGQLSLPADSGAKAPTLGEWHAPPPHPRLTHSGHPQKSRRLFRSPFIPPKIWTLEPYANYSVFIL
jgi:hypothetical protein